MTAALRGVKRELVRQLRERDASVVELAEALGVTRQTIYNWLKR